MRVCVYVVLVLIMLFLLLLLLLFVCVVRIVIMVDFCRCCEHDRPAALVVLLSFWLCIVFMLLWLML